jgi:glycosyltransferase involved in cell wall biosynthesis
MMPPDLVGVRCPDAAGSATAQRQVSLKLSIVIPTLRSEQYVATCINDLDSLCWSDCEIIVVDQGRNPPADRGKVGVRVRNIFLDAPNACLARNIGLREARHEIVLFLDDDVRIEDTDFLRKHMRHYEDPEVPGVYGQVLEVNEAPTDLPEPVDIETDWGWMSLPPNYARPCRTRDGKTANLSVRRDWAIAVGGMDAWFERGARREETEFNLRYTKRYGSLVFDPEASLIHLSAGAGSRTWGHVRRTVPMHHIVGHWYFFLRTMLDRTLGRRGIWLELRHIAIALLKNPQVGWNPVTFVVNAARGVWGLAIALARAARGPRRIATLDPKGYREIHPGEAAR